MQVDESFCLSGNFGRQLKTRIVNSKQSKAKLFIANLHTSLCFCLRELIDQISSLYRFGSKYSFPISCAFFCCDLMNSYTRNQCFCRWSSMIGVYYFSFTVIITPAMQSFSFFLINKLSCKISRILERISKLSSFEFTLKPSSSFFMYVSFSLLAWMICWTPQSCVDFRAMSDMLLSSICLKKWWILSINFSRSCLFCSRNFRRSAIFRSDSTIQSRALSDCKSFSRSCCF